MTPNDPHTGSTPRRGRSIGALAARKREELEQFEAARKLSLEKMNRTRAEMSRAVAEAEAMARRQLRNQQLADQKRLKFILGGLVLDALRVQGSTAPSITAQDLRRLTEKEQQLLTEVLAASVNDSNTNTDKVKPDTESDQDGVDIPV